MKKILAVIMLFYVGCSVASMIPAKNFDPSKNHEIIEWKFNNINDGLFFLLGPESTHFLTIYVNSLNENGSISDPVTVFCNASKYRITAGERLDCYGNYNDVISMSIQSEDFKNGSSGSYSYSKN